MTTKHCKHCGVAITHRNRVKFIKKGKIYYRGTCRKCTTRIQTLWCISRPPRMLICDFCGRSWMCPPLKSNGSYRRTCSDKCANALRIQTRLRNKAISQHAIHIQQSPSDPRELDWRNALHNPF